MFRLFFCLGAGFAGLAVFTGAFGAHFLSKRISSEMLNVFEIGSRYQMYHALGLFVVAWSMCQWKAQLLKVAGWSFVLGILLFSSSLYVLSFTGIRWLGSITPFGGVCFIVGWICLLISAIHNNLI